jgi:hypothetical protein
MIPTSGAQSGAFDVTPNVIEANTRLVTAPRRQRG